MSANHEDDLSTGRRYKKYEHAYNLAFAADPDKNLRRFDEMAPKDDAQWKRLEVYRGNDKNACDAYRSNAHDVLVKPTEKEEQMWLANQADHWRIDREPGFGQNDMTNNKWFDLTLEQRRGESSQKFFDRVEERHGAGYDVWAGKAGKDLVAKEDYLQTMASLDIEKLQAARQQKLQTQQDQPAQAQVSERAPEQTPVPVQQAQPAPTEVADAPATVEAPKRSRLSISNFTSPEEFIAQNQKELAQLDDGGRKQFMAETDAVHQEMGKGPIADAAPREAVIQAYRAQEEQLQIQRQQEVPSQTQTQRRTLHQ